MNQKVQTARGGSQRGLIRAGECRPLLAESDLQQGSKAGAGTPEKGFSKSLPLHRVPAQPWGPRPRPPSGLRAGWCLVPLHVAP